MERSFMRSFVDICPSYPEAMSFVSVVSIYFF